MDLFESVKKTSELIEKLNIEKEKLNTIITSTFVELPYKVQEIQATYREDMEEKERSVSVYYPIFETPNGFTKEKEVYYRKYANQIIHEYILKDDKKRSIQIKELGHFKQGTIKKSDKGIVVFIKNIISEIIKLEINIDGKILQIDKMIPYKDMLNQVLGEDNIAKMKSYYYIEENQIQMQQCKNFFENLGATKIPSLEELYKMNNEEIQITEMIKAKIEINYRAKDIFIWLENKNFRVRLDKVAVISASIKVLPYMKGNINIIPQSYEYIHLIDEVKWRNGITLEQAIEMIKE